MKKQKKKEHIQNGATQFGTGLPTLGGGNHTVCSSYQGLGPPPAILYLQGDKIVLQKVEAILSERGG